MTTAHHSPRWYSGVSTHFQMPSDASLPRATSREPAPTVRAQTTPRTGVCPPCTENNSIQSGHCASMTSGQQGGGSGSCGRRRRRSMPGGGAPYWCTCSSGRLRNDILSLLLPEVLDPILFEEVTDLSAADQLRVDVMVKVLLAADPQMDCSSSWRFEMTWTRSGTR